MLKKKTHLILYVFQKVFFLFPLVWKHCPSTDKFIYILTQPLPSIKMISAKQISGEKNHLNISVISLWSGALAIYRKKEKIWKTWSFKGNIFCCFSVNLREVREVRDGKNSKDFDRWPEEARKYDPSVCFVILYGNDFKLKTLSVAGKSP